MTFHEARPEPPATLSGSPFMPGSRVPAASDGWTDLIAAPMEPRDFAGAHDAKSGTDISTKEIKQLLPVLCKRRTVRIPNALNRLVASSVELLCVLFGVSFERGGDVYTAKRKA